MMILEKLNFLIQYLLKENREVNIDKLPTNITQKKNLYRSLCNIRGPKPISEKYIEVENAYLQGLGCFVPCHKCIFQLENFDFQKNKQVKLQLPQ